MTLPHRCLQCGVQVGAYMPHNCDVAGAWARIAELERERDEARAEVERLNKLDDRNQDRIAELHDACESKQYALTSETSLLNEARAQLATVMKERNAMRAALEEASARTVAGHLGMVRESGREQGCLHCIVTLPLREI